MRLVVLFAVSMGCGGSGGGGGNNTPIEPNIESIHENLLNRSCIFSSCHHQGQSTPSGGLALASDETAATSVEEISIACANLVNVPANNTLQLAADPATVRVIPGDAENSFLVKKLEGRDLEDEGKDNGRMPQSCTDDSCLPEEEIAVVREWIDAGATGCD